MHTTEQVRKMLRTKEFWSLNVFVFVHRCVPVCWGAPQELATLSLCFPLRNGRLGGKTFVTFDTSEGITGETNGSRND